MTAIRIPASRPAEVKPPEGDPASADTLAEALYAASGRYEEFADEAVTLSNLQSIWWGESFEAYQGAAATVGGEHARMATTIERVARATTSYADTLRDLERSYDDLVERKTALDGNRDLLIEEVRRAEDPTPAEVAGFQTWANNLDGSYDELVTDHDSYRRAVRANEDLLRQSFHNGTTLEGALSADGGLNDLAVGALNRPGAPGPDSSPEEVHDWWQGLTEAEREAVIAADPSLIGSADGLPADARDQANRVVLDDDLATLGAKEDDGTLSDAEQQVLDNARATEEALAAADGYVDPTTDEKPGGLLYLYDPSAYGGDGRVAVAVGDLDTADDVAISIPGITTEHTDVGRYTEQAINLYESTRYNGDGSSVATLFWLGYNTPEGAIDWDTMTRGRAEDGGALLADAVEGLRASRPDDPAHMTAIGHSYGSTTTSYAAVDHDLAVDDVVLIGSPGAGPADSADDFSVGEDNVWTGRNSGDLVAVLGDEGWVHTPGGLGMDPSSEDFDANRFEAESTERGSIRNFDDHSRYYDPDSESLYNLGRIVDGDYGNVNEADQSYDPFFGFAEDPEADRDPTGNEPGRSDTTPRR